jgi:hypothetical protein
MKIILLLLCVLLSAFAQKAGSCCPPPKLVTIPKYITVHVPEYVETLEFKPLPVVAVCPTDYKQEKRLCIKIIKSTTVCPTGAFRVNDTECRIVKVISKNAPKTKPIICPKGYAQKGKYRCVKVLKCPKGYQKQNGDCIPVEITCPEGSIRFGRSCIYQVRKCPAGYILKDKKCLKELSWCPTGYTLVGNECKSNLACPIGYKLSKGMCFKVMTRCADGSKKGRRGRCVETLKSTQNCPKDWVLFNGACKKVQIECPFGFVLNGKCETQSCKCDNKFEPVCGFDGITYKNACEALCLKSTIRYVGACACGNKCPSYLEPVCGSDGVTYQNSCIARVNGVSMIKGQC